MNEKHGGLPRGCIPYDSKNTGGKNFQMKHQKRLFLLLLLTQKKTKKIVISNLVMVKSNSLNPSRGSKSCGLHVHNV